MNCLLTFLDSGVIGSLSATVTVVQAVQSVTLDFSVLSKSRSGEWIKVIGDTDDLCEWATVTQGGSKLKDCDLAEGKAVIERDVELPHGFVPEVSNDLCFVFSFSTSFSFSWKS